MEWSDRSILFSNVIGSLCLPCFVKVEKDVSSESRLESFSTNDILSLHTIISMKQVRMQKLNVKTFELSDELFVPVDYDGFFKILILDAHMEYRMLKELLNPPPRFVSVKKDFKSPTGVQFLRDTAFEIISVGERKQGIDTQVLVRYNHEAIYLPDFTAGSFTPLEDQTVFLLKDIVYKNIFPQIVKFMDLSYTNFTTLSDDQVFQVNGVVERQVAVGTNNCQNSTFILPVESDIQIRKQKETSSNDSFKDTIVQPIQNQEHPLQRPGLPMPARQHKSSLPLPDTNRTRNGNAKPSTVKPCSSLPEDTTVQPIQKQEHPLHRPGIPMPTRQPELPLPVPDTDRKQQASSPKDGDRKPSTAKPCSSLPKGNVEMEWSEETWSFSEAIESLTLPCVVKVAENMDTFFSGDTLQINKIIKIKQAVMQKIDSDSMKTSCEFYVSLDFDGRFKMAIPHKSRKCRVLDDLFDIDFIPRFVRIHETFTSPSGERFQKGTHFEILNVINKNHESNKQVLVKYGCEEILISAFANGSFSVLEDDTIFRLTEIMSKNAIPLFVKPLDRKFKGFTTPFTENDIFRINRFINRDVAIGKYLSWNGLSEEQNEDLGEFNLPIDSYINVCLQKREPDKKPDRTNRDDGFGRERIKSTEEASPCRYNLERYSGKTKLPPPRHEKKDSSEVDVPPDLPTYDRRVSLHKHTVLTMSVRELSETLRYCAMNTLADKIESLHLDGKNVSCMKNEELLSNPFNLSTYELKKFRCIVSGWRPKLL